MKTIAELLADVTNETNAIAAADMGLKAVQAFIIDTQVKFDVNDTVGIKDGLTNLAGLVTGLITAIPANVIPASAGPVGKSPKEQFLDQAHEVAVKSLDDMKAAAVRINNLVVELSKFAEHASQTKIAAEAGIESQKAA